MKTEWNLELLYKSGTDPQIERDIKKYENACILFEKKYKKNSSFTKSESSLLKALEEYEKLYSMPEPRKADYFYYRKDLNAKDQEAESKMNQLSQRITQA